MRVGPLFSVRIDTRQDIASLALVGELDMASAPILEDRLAFLEGDGVAVVMLDLGGLTFIDSTGLQVLLQAWGRAKSNGHRLILVRASRPTRRLLELTRTVFLLDDEEVCSTV